jgi:hypothetical protein
MVRFDRTIGDLGGWEICAAHQDPFRDHSHGVGVRSVVTRQDWEDAPAVVIEARAEQMYHASFDPANQSPGQVVGRVKSIFVEFVKAATR